MFKILAGILLFCLQAVSVMAADLSPELLHDIAPSGRLRIAINFGNPVLAQPGPSAGDPRGVSAELARELGRRLHLPIDFVTFDAAGKVFDALKDNGWDVAFLAIDPVRASLITFSNPYVLIEGTYLVAADSPFKTVEEVDKTGIRIAVGRGSAYDLYLTRALKNAERVETPSSAEALDVFLRDRLEAAAGVRQPLVAFAASHPGLRVLPGQFMSIRQAIAAPKGRDKAARYLNAFIEEMKASGFVARALQASGQAEATVAPAMPQ
jgi:polar amino acid transport system substrate-binding protein